MRVRVDTEGNFGFWGQLSWANFVDWLITGLLALILVFSFWKAGSPEDGSFAILPLIVLLIFLHAVWVCLNEEVPRRISQVPLFFLPFFIWIVLRSGSAASDRFLSQIEWLCWLEVFVFFWVLANNVRLRAQTTLLFATVLGLQLSALLAPLWNRTIGAERWEPLPGDASGNAVELFLAGSNLFTNTELWGAYILMFVPAACGIALLPRLEVVARYFYAFLVVFSLHALALGAVYWAWALALLWVGFLLYEFGALSRKLRVVFVGGAIALSCLILGFGYWGFNPAAFAVEIGAAVCGDVGRFFWGMGRGAWFPGSNHLMATWGSDAAMLFFQYGFIGAMLLLLPYLYLLRMGLRGYRAYPRLSSRGRGRQRVVKYERFCLLIALLVGSAGILNFFLAHALYTPVVFLQLALSLSLIVKLAFRRKILLPDHRSFRLAYCFGAGAMACFLIIKGTA